MNLNNDMFATDTKKNKFDSTQHIYGTLSLSIRTINTRRGLHFFSIQPKCQNEKHSKEVSDYVDFWRNLLEGFTWLDILTISADRRGLCLGMNSYFECELQNGGWLPSDFEPKNLLILNPGTPLRLTCLIFKNFVLPLWLKIRKCQLVTCLRRVSFLTANSAHKAGSGSGARHYIFLAKRWVLKKFYIEEEVSEAKKIN